MFSIFFYFVVVLLIYTTHQPTEETNFSFPETVLLFMLLLGCFTFLTRFQFRRLEKKVAFLSTGRLDNEFHSLMMKQSIGAIVLFTIFIYGLNLPSFFVPMRIFSTLPTLLASVFIGLFVALLTIIWNAAYPCYSTIYASSLSKRSYIFSNISFSAPVLLPWLFLSGIADFIFALPFHLPKKILSTTEGEVAYFLVFLILVAMLGPAMMQFFWRCKPLENGYLRNRIENLCERARLRYANILYWPIFGGKMITAGVMGLIRNFRYILVTKALLQYLEPAEIDAVIAHEIGHVKKKHLLFYLLFFSGYMLLSYTTYDLVIYATIYAEPVFRTIGSMGLNQMTVTAFFFSSAVIVIFLLYFRFIFGFFMRNFERQADCYVYQLFESGIPLITTLEKISQASGQSPDKPNWHHFSISERIRYLKLCERDRSWITRQDRKIHQSIVLFAAALAAVAVAGYTLNFTDTGKIWNSRLFERILLGEIEKSPHNPNLYGLLGEIHFTAKNYGGAIQAYETSLKLNPDQPNVLNNLAWLYATCEDIRFRNPEKALDLALRAASFERSPHILDTLAESYYVNNRIPEAVETARQALHEAAKDHGYFRRQLEKYRQANRSEIGSDH
jgi:Zn-dependent protease with chaperone function